jgi:Pyruvate/2-oxoacid:ferredoxin oxidoreductase delta subunit
VSRYLTKQQRLELTTTLQPCPLCGTTDELALCIMVCCDPADLDEGQAGGTWSVYCSGCGIVLPGFDGITLLAKRWNERTN